MSEACDLAYFLCECKGVRFYGQSGRRLRFGTRLNLVREPSNPHDSNAVAVSVVGEGGGRSSLGHVSSQAARWLSPLMLGPFDFVA